MAEVVYQRGESDVRPWGRWEVLEVGDGFVVKTITVEPGGVLSLQMHHHREEHWIVVAGTAEITLGERVFDAAFNEHVHIPLAVKHRIANRGSSPVTFIEVQTGEKLDENDIVRFEDSYGRS